MVVQPLWANVYGWRESLYPYLLVNVSNVKKTLMMISVQVVETSVKCHHKRRVLLKITIIFYLLLMTPGFKPFTVFMS